MRAALILFGIAGVLVLGSLCCWHQWINRPLAERQMFDVAAAGMGKTVWVETLPPPKGFVPEGPWGERRFLFHHAGCPLMPGKGFPVARESLIGGPLDYYPCDWCFPMPQGRRWAWNWAIGLGVGGIGVCACGAVLTLRPRRCLRCGCRRIGAFCARCGAKLVTNR